MVDSKTLWVTSISAYNGDDGECVIELECRDNEGTHCFRMYESTLTEFCAKELPKHGYFPLKKGAEFGAAGVKKD